MPATTGFERRLVGRTVEQGDRGAGLHHGGFSGQGAGQAQAIQDLEHARFQHKARTESFDA
ncbi:hypothetical protein D3C87_1368680 [compost metagenome]